MTAGHRSTKNSKVTIYEVDVAHDLARLSSPEFEARSDNVGFPVGSANNVHSGDKVRVIGYPYDITSQEIEIPLTVGTPARKILGTAAGSNLTAALNTRRSPLSTLSILYINGSLNPGHSGAPIMAGTQVIGVGNGGLAVGSGVGWAIVLEGLHWEKRDSSMDYRRVKDLSTIGLYSYDSDPVLTQSRLLTLLEKRLGKVERDVKDTARILAILEKEFHINGDRIDAIIKRLDSMPLPSQAAKQAAEQINEHDDDYAKGLKAVAEGRKDDARDFLQKAEEKREQGDVRVAIERVLSSFTDNQKIPPDLIGKQNPAHDASDGGPIRRELLEYETKPRDMKLNDSYFRCYTDGSVGLLMVFVTDKGALEMGKDARTKFDSACDDLYSAFTDRYQVSEIQRPNILERDWTVNDRITVHCVWQGWGYIDITLH